MDLSVTVTQKRLLGRLARKLFTSVDGGPSTFFLVDGHKALLLAFSFHRKIKALKMCKMCDKDIDN